MRNDQELPYWLVRAAQDADKVVRSTRPYIRALEQYINEGFAAQTLPASLLAYLDQAMQAMDAGMAQAGAAVTGSASLTVTPVMIAEAEVVKATERASVTVLDAPRRPALLVDRLAFALILVWLVALAMPAAQRHLPPEAQDILNGLYKTIPIALTVTVVARQKRKG